MRLITSLVMFLYFFTSHYFFNVRSHKRNERKDVDEPAISWTVCKTYRGLTKWQQNICYKYPDVTTIAMQGLDIAVQECQFQFRRHRWNCSSLTNKSHNPHNSVLLKKGYRESAFSHAISAAGITYSVAKACSMGKLMACGCEPRTLFKQNPSNNSTSTSSTKLRNTSRWKWGGCSHNMDFGVHFSKLFLDNKEKHATDIHSLINIHNNAAGRIAVLRQMQVRCKCHGMSGSCEMKTCWKTAPEFRVIGDLLKERFRSAILVNQSNLGNGSPVVQRERNLQRRKNNRKRRRRKRLKRYKLLNISLDLLYYQKSPTFCEKDATVDFAGTTGRVCNRTSRDIDGCSSLCCGRGYNVVRQKRIERCNCKFHWCCYVTCENCTIYEWITVCK